MTATVHRLCDYKSLEERQIEIDRFCLAVVDEALNAPALPDDFPDEYRVADQIRDSGVLLEYPRDAS